MTRDVSIVSRDPTKKEQIGENRVVDHCVITGQIEGTDNFFVAPIDADNTTTRAGLSCFSVAWICDD